MLEQKLKEVIASYKDFPREGILFRDIMPILQNHQLFRELVEHISELNIVKESEAVLAIDARGFIFGSAVALLAEKPIVTARKPGKLPGDLLSASYNLEYGENILCLQKKALLDYKKFCIVDDLLATGGTVACVEKMLVDEKKTITGVAVIIELLELNGKDKLNSKVESVVKY